MIDLTAEQKRNLAKSVNVYLGTEREIFELMYFYTRGRFEYLKEHEMSDTDFERTLCYLDFFRDIRGILFDK